MYLGQSTDHVVRDSYVLRCYDVADESPTRSEEMIERVEKVGKEGWMNGRKKGKNEGNEEERKERRKKEVRKKGRKKGRNEWTN